MEALATYLIKSSVWLTGFALVYALFLRNERFFTLNRIYLVSGILVSIIFPLFTWHYTILLPVVPSIEVSDPVVQGIVVPEESFTTQNMLLLGYLSGILFLVFRILRQTLPVFRIIKKSETHSYHSVQLIRTDAYPASFSFFSFVFVNPSIDEIETNEIVNHELEHIRQQHWIDLLLFEILRTMQWFNPVSWLYGHLIRQNHEYLADEHALQRSSNPAIYRAALLNQMFGGPVISLANSFNYSLNKKRFNMMKHTIRSPLRKLKLLMVLPLIAGVFYAFAAPEYKVQQVKENSELVQGHTIQDTNTVKGKVLNEDRKPLKESGTTLKGNFVKHSSKDTASAPGLNFNAKNLHGNYKNWAKIIKADTISVDFAKSNSLFFIDGKETAKSEVDQLNPDRIESVTVLKGESATTKYGTKGKNGAIEITLKTDGKKAAFQTIKVQTNSPLKFGNSDGSVSQPLIVKDGVIVKGMNVNNIPPETIESVNVMKGEQATKIYGDKGRNGVVEIRTKKGNAKDLKSTSEPIPVRITGYSNDQKTNASNQPNSGVQILNTGTSGTEPKPLIVIDGVIAENQNMKDIDPETVKSVNVLKGETAIRKYGDKGKNGVVEITLKHPEEAGIIVEALPEFPGGIEALKKFVASSLEYPAIAMENGIHGQVVVGFVVSKNGEITDVKVKSGVDASLDKEAMRIVKSMPRWIPGKQNGQGVDVFYKLPINFNLPKDYHPVSKEKLRAGTPSTIGNINWVNNSVYNSSKLNNILGMKKGDEYSKENLKGRIGGEVSSLYLDNGYLFSNIEITEIPKSDGTVDLTFTIYEGNRGKIGKIDIKGNKNVSTEDILNEIEIKKGDLFSKARIIQAVRTISKMGKFNPEEIKPEIIPESKILNSEFINVNLVFNVAEK